MPLAMQIRIRFFAIARERAGVSELMMDLADGSTVSDAAEMIRRRFPDLREVLPRCALALNRDYAPAETKLHENDELAIIPPVSGG